MFYLNTTPKFYEYAFRFYPYICDAVRNFALELIEDEEYKSTLRRKQIFVNFKDVPNKEAVRELHSYKVGTLVRISGQVVRTHPVHPELWRGTFVCDECGVTIRGVVQHFRYTPVSPVNCLSAFMFIFLAQPVY